MRVQQETREIEVAAPAEGGRGTRERTVSDRVLGWIGGAMVVGALYLLVAGGVTDDGVSAGPVPGLELLSPAAGAAVDLPLEIRFRTDAPLSIQPGGWGAAGYHIHAEIAGREAMPAPDDIRRLSDGSYSWTLGGVPPGESTLRLLWSDAAHRAIAEGATERIPLTIR